MTDEYEPKGPLSYGYERAPHGEVATFVVHEKRGDEFRALCLISGTTAEHVYRLVSQIEGELAAALNAQERVKELEGALQYVCECFEAAFIEGLLDRALETCTGEPGTLYDLLTHRLMPGLDRARAALKSDEGDQQ